METIESVLPDRARKSRRRAIVGLAVGVSSIAVLQVLAPSTDHQMANMASFLIGLIQDRAETNNQAAARPQKLAALKNLWQEMNQRHSALAKTE